MNTEEKVKSILIELKSLNASDVNWNSNVDIIEDIGLDSLQIINFLLKLEDQLNIEIDFEEFNFNHLRSLEKFCSFLEKNYKLN
jgi:acyl carrier protein